MTFQNGYTCACCGNVHEELPLSYGSPAPALWFSLAPEERDERCLMNDELCVIDDEHYFVRGCIEIPVIDSEDTFIWNVWVSLSKENFKRTYLYWEEEGREKELEPMFGWLSTSLSWYPDTTLHLKTLVHTRPVGVRPYIELEQTDHPLSIEQRAGITRARVIEIAEALCQGS
ncbi:DUF2199 domain-containing protein [Brevibacillus sp. SIMBA_040]|uniref:DUF2199 domain-containing protein n=1 Tax=unclassified Brevibacillus TaxID=2684853 RepID=UPI00397E6DD9